MKLGSLEIDEEKLSQIDLHFFKVDYSGREIDAIDREAGVEFYKLYAYISSLYDDIKIADIGSRYGNSALALSYNENNVVDSFDVDYEKVEFCKAFRVRENINFFWKDMLEHPSLLDYQIISLDVDPHDSLKEDICLKFLESNKWSGLVLLDDIGLEWPEMNTWWNSLPYEKYDLTAIGHQSGTGAVIF